MWCVLRVIAPCRLSVWCVFRVIAPYCYDCCVFNRWPKRSSTPKISTTRRCRHWGKWMNLTTQTGNCCKRQTPQIGPQHDQLVRHTSPSNSSCQWLSLVAWQQHQLLPLSCGGSLLPSQWNTALSFTWQFVCSEVRQLMPAPKKLQGLTSRRHLCIQVTILGFVPCFQQTSPPPPPPPFPLCYF